MNHSKLWSKLQIVSIRNLRYLSPCSVLANIFEFVGLAVIAYYIFGSPLPRCHHEDNGDDGHNHDDDDEAHMMTTTSISTSKVTNPSSAQAAFPGSHLRANSQSSLAPPSLLLRFDLSILIVPKSCANERWSGNQRGPSDREPDDQTPGTCKKQKILVDLKLLLFVSRVCLSLIFPQDMLGWNGVLNTSMVTIAW